VIRIIAKIVKAMHETAWKMDRQYFSASETLSALLHLHTYQWEMRSCVQTTFNNVIHII